MADQNVQDFSIPEPAWPFLRIWGAAPQYRVVALLTPNLQSLLHCKCKHRSQIPMTPAPWGLDSNSLINIQFVKTSVYFSSPPPRFLIKHSLIRMTLSLFSLQSLLLKHTEIEPITERIIFKKHLR